MLFEKFSLFAPSLHFYSYDCRGIFFFFRFSLLAFIRIFAFLQLVLWEVPHFSPPPDLDFDLLSIMENLLRIFLFCMETVALKRRKSELVSCLSQNTSIVQTFPKNIVIPLCRSFCSCVMRFQVTAVEKMTFIGKLLVHWMSDEVAI